MKYKKGSVHIEAEEIRIGKNVRWGKNIDVKVRGIFEIGDFSRLGDDVKIRGNNIHFGKHLYHSSGLVVGGGGSGGPNANLTVGDRCTIHNNFLNVCEPIYIGDDVGLSPESSILTHGFWGSVLDGHPRKYAKVLIGDGVIVGYRSTILPGAWISNDAIIGACSVVHSYVSPNAICAGSPARLIRNIEEPTKEEKEKIFKDIIKGFHSAHGDYPVIILGNFWCNAETFEYGGVENEATDKLRDYLRKYGIRIYTERPF